MLLAKNNLEIAELCPKASNRYTLMSVYICPDKTVVSDAKYLIEVQAPNSEAAEFPTLDGCTQAETFEPFLLPAEAAQKVAKAIPTKSKLPILHHVAVGAEADSEFAKLATTDLDAPTITRVRKTRGQFLAYDHLFPTTAPALKICFDANKLAKLLNGISKAMGKGKNEEAVVTMELWDATTTAKITAKSDAGQEIRALIMLCNP